MNSRNYYIVSGIIFAFVACMHLVRILSRFVFVIGSWHVPIWISCLGFIVAGYLSYSAHQLAQGKKGKVS